MIILYVLYKGEQILSDPSIIKTKKERSKWRSLVFENSHIISFGREHDLVLKNLIGKIKDFRRKGAN